MIAESRSHQPFRRARHVGIIVLLACTLAACRRPAPQGTSDAGHDHEHEAAAAAPSNRVAVPDAVRRSLGVTFAKVERRNVEKTLRVPGRFELEPLARREYRPAIAGRITILVDQLARVKAGDMLYRLDAPGWREMQERIANAEAAVAQTKARLDSMVPLMKAHEEHERGLAEKVALWTERIAQLERVREAGGGQHGEFVQARAILSETQAEYADVREKDAELESRRAESVAELQASRTRLDLLMRSAAILTGMSMESLSSTGASGLPMWHELTTLEVRADADGVVELIEVTNGAHIEATALAIRVVQPERVRFRAFALQSDIARLHEGMTARIVPPTAAIATQSALAANVVLGLRADPDERTAELVASPTSLEPWARAGVSGFLELVLEGAAGELAVPSGAIVRDGVTPVLFRRDPKDPDTVIRLSADIGPSDGRWTAILSGLAEGDEVVLDGVYPLLLATSGSIPKGGHFHSDGTFHDGKD
jgi:multidrug efflux pump subunit AcrA (membrane-fusion protein)